MVVIITGELKHEHVQSLLNSMWSSICHIVNTESLKKLNVNCRYLKYKSSESIFVVAKHINLDCCSCISGEVILNVENIIFGCCS